MNKIKKVSFEASQELIDQVVKAQKQISNQEYKKYKAMAEHFGGKMIIEDPEKMKFCVNCEIDGYLANIARRYAEETNYRVCLSQKGRIKPKFGDELIERLEIITAKSKKFVDLLTNELTVYAKK